MLSSPPPFLVVCASLWLLFPYGFLFGLNEIPVSLTVELTLNPIMSCPNPLLVAQPVPISEFSPPWSFTPNIKLAFQPWVSPLRCRNNSPAFSPLRFPAIGLPMLVTSHLSLTVSTVSEVILHACRSYFEASLLLYLV
jgi:hypothetical protein